MANPTDKDLSRAEEVKTLSTSPQPHKRPDEPLPTPADPTRSALDIVTTSSEAYEELPPERKTITHLGFADPDAHFERKPLENKKLIAITTPNSQSATELERQIIGSGMALPLGTPIIACPDSTTTTRIYFVPELANTFAIAEISKTIGIPATIHHSNHASEVIRFRDHVIPLDSELLTHTPEHPTTRTSIQVSNRNRDQAEETEEPSERKAPQVLDEPVFSSVSLQSRSLELAQKPDSMEKNFVAESSYLILDINTLLRDQADNGKHVENVLARIAGLAVSEDFSVFPDQKGHLVIINRAQRSGSFMTLLAREITKLTKGKSNILIEKGNFKRDNSQFGIEGYPQASTISLWQELGAENPSCFLTPEMKKTLTTGRDGTIIKFETTPADPSGELLTLSNVERNAKLHISGPDRLIGYKEELDQLLKATNPNSATKLTIVNGSAGTGKSRLVNELLQNHPHALVHSVDPSGENIPGAALVDLARTIFNEVNKKLSEGVKARFSVEIGILEEFMDKSEDEQIKHAQLMPEDLVGVLATTYLKLLEKSCGSFLLVIDDAHHIDRHSEKHIMNLLEKFLLTSQSKAVMLRRPEEIYHSAAQNNLASTIRLKCRQQDLSRGLEPLQNNVEVVNLTDPETGKPKLDIQNPETTNEYAFYSLPVNLRINQETGEARSLGNWPQELAGKCRTPFDFTSIMDSLLENPEISFIVGVDNIALSPEAIKTFSGVKNHGDLLVYHQNRMRRLPDNAKSLLQCVALMGTKVSYNNLKVIAKEIAEIPDTEIEVAIVNLSKGGYILTHEDGGFAIQHDNYRDIAITSLNAKEKNRLILKIYEQFQDSEEMHNDRKFGLLAEISDSLPITKTTKKFWGHYVEHGNKAMDDATKERAYGRGYSIGMTILGNLETANQSTMGKVLTALRTDPQAARKVPPQIQELLKNALFAVVSNGLPLGRFQKITEAIEILEVMGADELLTEAYSTGFRTAQIQMDTTAMKDFYTKVKNRPDLEPHNDLSMQIRLAFKKENFKECQRLFRDNSELIDSLKNTNETAYTEFTRLRQRIMFDHIRKNLENYHGVDGDVVLDPSWLSENETKEFHRIEQELERINEEREAHPDKFDSLQELHLLDQLAELAAFLGNYEAASQAYSEVWRIAQQMQIPTEAARAAKFKGDVEIMMAIAHIKHPTGNQQGEASAIKNGTILRKHVIKAIQTYSENGFTALEKVEEKNDWQLIMRAQRMRAVSILIRSYENEIAEEKQYDLALNDSLAEIKSQLIPHLRSAIQDFNEIMESPIWKKPFTTPETEGIYSYYVTSSMGHILECIEDLGITEDELGLEIPDILDDAKYAAFNHGRISEGLKFATNMKDNVGEVDKGKLPGFSKYISHGERRSIRKKNTEVAEKFSQLRAQHKSVVTKRQASLAT